MSDPTSPGAVALQIERNNQSPSQRTKQQQQQEQRQRHRPLFTLFTVLACVGVFLWEIYLNNWKLESPTVNPLYGPSQATLLQAGAKRTDLIVDKGEWWRLFMPVYLHGGIIHLVVNLVGLYQLGTNLEGFYGSLRIALIYFFSGVVGNIVSALFLPSTLTVGASGAIFGLLGAAWADLIQNWRMIESPCCQFLGLLLSTILNVVLGFMPFLDNFCHLGGMFAGFSLGLVLLVNKDNRVQRSFQQICCTQCGLVLSIVSTLIFLALLYTGTNGDDFCPECQRLNCYPIKGMWSCDVVIGCNVQDPGGFRLNIPPGASSQIGAFNTTGEVICSDKDKALASSTINVEVVLVACPETATEQDAMCLFHATNVCYRCAGTTSQKEIDVGFQCSCQVKACLVCDSEEVPQ